MMRLPYPNAARSPLPLGFHYQVATTQIPLMLGFHMAVGVEGGWFHSHRFHIKHPAASSASSTDHHDEDHKLIGIGCYAW
jgi:hypothetical protein